MILEPGLMVLWTVYVSNIALFIVIRHVFRDEEALNELVSFEVRV